MKRTQKYFLFLVNLTIMASLCLMGQYSVSAQSSAQAAIEAVSPPLFPDLTWKDLGNVQKDVYVYNQTLNLSGNMFAAIETYQGGIPESVFDYYSAKNLKSLGWSSVGRSGFESTYWHSSGRYLTVQIEDCPNFQNDYCVNVWQSADSGNMLPSAIPLSIAPINTIVAFSKTTPTNGSTIALPASSYHVLEWGDAAIGSSDRYEYCIDESNNGQCNSSWKTRNSLYSGDGEFTLTVGHTYYWQVRTKNNPVVYANGSSTAWWSFTVKAADAFSKIAPAKGSTIAFPATTQYLLQWNALAGIASTDRYQYCIDETNNQSCDSNWILRDSLYSGPGEFTLVSGHTYYWQVRARDANTYANSGTWWSFTVTGTPAGPAVLSIVRANPTSATTSAASVSFTVTFSTAVTGVDISDFALTTSGITGASITGVTGSGAIYTVTVNTGVGDGTIRLDVIDNDSIINAQNIPLGGAGVGNGNFVGGQSYTIDKAPIVLSIVRSVPNSVNLLNVNFTVTFSEAVAILGVNDLTLTTSGVSGATVSGVSGTGSVYTVTVNTGTGNGTVRLNLRDDDTIRDSSGNPLGGPGLGNGDFTSGEAYTINKVVNTYVAGNLLGAYALSPSQSARDSYAGVDSGPLKVASTNVSLIIAALRDAWAANGVTTSYSQLMGLPQEQLSDQYVFPGYNNVTLDDQLRIANVDTSATTVTVTIGGTLRGTYPLAAGAAVRINYPGLDSGPVVVQGTSGVKIISSIREAWAVNGVTTSYVQLMGLPAGQLSNKYVFPAYNNVTLDEQLRIGNVDPTQSTSVTVTIGGTPHGPYPLGPGQAVRINYPGLDSGPVIVEGTAGVNIISSIRDAWAVNGVTTSYSQLMGLPAGQLSDKYVFPGYNNVSLDDQLRISNVDTVSSTVTVTVGGVLQGTYPLAAGQAVRINYPGLDSGPVVVQGTSSVKIISSIREAWAVNGVTTSYVQLMGLPAGQLSTTYLFPGYNNVTLNEQVRFAMP